MKKISEPITFFGSGPVAAASLELLAKDFVIEAVITKPRPGHHKGSVPVIELAERLGLPLFAAGTKVELDDLFARRPVKSRVAILIDFGIIISQGVIDYFELGIVNSHFSLLPEWRGADPITFSILSGQKRTGVSLMLLTAGMDEGALIGQAPYDIRSDETTPTLTKALIELSYESLKHIVPMYIEGSIHATPQETASIEPTYSRKLTKEDGKLDPNKTAIELEREIRAFHEWPRSRINLGGIDIIITQARAVSVPTEVKPGSYEVLSVSDDLILYCSKGYLSIDRVQPAGKKEMSAAEFVRGYKQRLQNIEGASD